MRRFVHRATCTDVHVVEGKNEGTVSDANREFTKYTHISATALMRFRTALDFSHHWDQVLLSTAMMSYLDLLCSRIQISKVSGPTDSISFLQSKGYNILLNSRDYLPDNQQKARAEPSSFNHFCKHERHNAGHSLHLHTHIASDYPHMSPHTAKIPFNTLSSRAPELQPSSRAQEMSPCDQYTPSLINVRALSQVLPFAGTSQGSRLHPFDSPHLRAES